MWVPSSQFSCIFPRIQRPPLSITDSVIALSARLRHTVTDRPLNPQCPCCFQSHRGAVVEKSPALSYDRKSHRSIDAIHRCDWFGFPLPSASLGALALAKSAHRSATSRAARRKRVLMYDVARISPFGHNISQWCAGSLWWGWRGKALCAMLEPARKHTYTRTTPYTEYYSGVGLAASEVIRNHKKHKESHMCYLIRSPFGGPSVACPWWEIIRNHKKS